MYKECYKITSLYPKIKLKKITIIYIYIKIYKVNLNVSKKKIRKFAYGRDNTKQAEMPDFPCGPSRQEKF